MLSQCDLMGFIPITNADRARTFYVDTLQTPVHLERPICTRRSRQRKRYSLHLRRNLHTRAIHHLWLEGYRHQHRGQ